MHKWIPALVLLTSIITPATHAAIYKCIGADGQTVFSQSRCGANSKAVPIRSEFKNTTNSTATGLRSGELRTLSHINSREKRRVQNR